MPKSNKPRSRNVAGGSPRYPGVRISVRSESPLVMVAAVRQELRLAGAPAEEIRAFSDRALSTGVDREVIRQAVEEWVGAAES